MARMTAGRSTDLQLLQLFFEAGKAVPGHRNFQHGQIHSKKAKEPLGRGARSVYGNRVATR